MTRYENLIHKAAILRDAAYRVTDPRMKIMYRRKQADLLIKARDLTIEEASYGLR